MACGDGSRCSVCNCYTDYDDGEFICDGCLSVAQNISPWMRNWQNIDVSMPPEHENVLVWDEMFNEPCIAFYSSFWKSFCYIKRGEPGLVYGEHWMPLPQGPEE